MKPKHVLILSLILFSTSTIAQTIRRVNNTGIPLGANMYASLQEAHNAASAGDIIQIEGSGSTYAGATITKKLTIIGPGYFLASNYPSFGDVRPADFYGANIIFDTGSEGSSISGCSNLAINVKVPNISIIGNNDLTVDIGYGSSISLTGILISKNYYVRPYGWTSKSAVLVISNNYIYSTYNLGDANYSGTFSNNIIGGSISLANFNTSNNILIQGTPSFSNCTFANNIDARALTNSSAFGTTNGNQANVDKTKLFVGLTGTSTDGQWKLKAGSVAIGAGTGGTDCGMFGGGDPYELSGISSADYPAIIKLTTSGTGSTTTPLSVTISTKSN